LWILGTVALEFDLRVVYNGMICCAFCDYAKLGGLWLFSCPNNAHVSI